MSYHLITCLILFIIMGLFQIATAIYFDRIVRFEHDNYYDQWIKDGRPNGFLWRSPDGTFLVSDMARTIHMNRLLFISPAWIRQHPDLLRYQRGLVITSAGFLIALALFAVVNLFVFSNLPVAG